jgi:hypothetical protein
MVSTTQLSFIATLKYVIHPELHRARIIEGHLLPQAEGMKRITVAGFPQCSYFQKAWSITSAMSMLYPQRLQAVKVELENRDAYKALALFHLQF